MLQRIIPATYAPVMSAIPKNSSAQYAHAKQRTRPKIGILLECGQSLPLEEKIKCKAEYKCKNKEKYNVDANGRRLNIGAFETDYNGEKYNADNIVYNCG
jgi:hypothetical protein